MPHLTIDYTNNVTGFEPAQVLEEMLDYLCGTPFFEEVDIKSRAVKLTAYRVGQNPDSRGFVHARLAILTGRTLENRQQLSTGLLDVLKRRVQPIEGLHLQLCVEIQEIERESYAKAVIDG